MYDSGCCGAGAINRAGCARGAAQEDNVTGVDTRDASPNLNALDDRELQRLRLSQLMGWPAILGFIRLWWEFTGNVSIVHWLNNAALARLLHISTSFISQYR